MLSYMKLFLVCSGSEGPRRPSGSWQAERRTEVNRRVWTAQRGGNRREGTATTRGIFVIKLSCFLLILTQPVARAGKCAIGTKRGKTCNGYQARETWSWCQIKRGKHVSSVKRGKQGAGVKLNAENMLAASSAGNKELVSNWMRETCWRCQAREKLNTPHH